MNLLWIASEGLPQEGDQGQKELLPAIAAFAVPGLLAAAFARLMVDQPNGRLSRRSKQTRLSWRWPKVQHF